MTTLRYELWDFPQMLRVRGEWNELVARSDCDPLFLSWEWQSQWWQHHGIPNGWTCCVIAVFAGDSLVAIAPMFARNIRRRGLSLRVAGPIGMGFRDSSLLLSEYLDIIAEPAHAAASARLAIDVLVNFISCHEVAISFASVDSHLAAALQERARQLGGFCRTIDPIRSYGVALRGGFAGYIAGLKSNARRSLWGLRTRLAEMGEVAFEAAESDSVGSTLELLNRLHAIRWGQPVYNRAQFEFHCRFAGTMCEMGRLALTTLSVAGRPISVLYDVRSGDKQYNLQMGFDPTFCPRVSLGLLHLGYAMEEAARLGIGTYDLLAGEGRSSNYKARFAQCPRDLISVQYLVPGRAARLYRIYNRLRGCFPGYK